MGGTNFNRNHAGHRGLVGSAIIRRLHKAGYENLLFIMFNSQSSELINIGTGIDQSISELAEIVRNVIGYPGGIDFDPTKPDGTPRKLHDVSKLTALGWKPKFTLEEGIKQAYKSYKAVATKKESTNIL